MQSQILIQMHDSEEMTQFSAKTNSSPPSMKCTANLKTLGIGNLSLPITGMCLHQVLR